MADATQIQPNARPYIHIWQFHANLYKKKLISQLLYVNFYTYKKNLKKKLNYVGSVIDVAVVVVHSVKLKLLLKMAWQMLKTMRNATISNLIWK